MRNHLSIGATASVWALALLAGCAATELAPIRGAGFQPDADEQQLWDTARRVDEALRERDALYDDAALETYLDGVMARLAPELAGGSGAVHAQVLRDPYLNAFALPNGSIYLHTGLLASIDNEAQLATILAHELVHYSERHAIERQHAAENRALTMQVVFGVLAVAAAGASGDANAARAMLDLGRAVAPTIVAVQVTGYSRDLEREADAQGFDRLVAAGYDPREATKVFALLQADAAESKVEEPFFFGSHPRLAERVESYQALLADRPDATGATGAAAYGAAVAQLRLDNARSDIAMGRTERARHAIARHLDTRPQSAPGLFLLGEAARRAGDADAARRAYEAAAAADGAYAPPHRELGLLCRTSGDATGARAAFGRYLALAPAAADRPIIEAYIDEADGGSP